MCTNCDECVHCKFIKGSVRGIMDADPDEYYCKIDSENFNEDVDCEDFEYSDPLDHYYGQYDAADYYYDTMREAQFD